MMPNNTTGNDNPLADMLEDINWSRRTLGHYLGVDETTIRRWCRPGAPPPPKEHKARLKLVAKAAALIKFREVPTPTE